MPYEEEMPKLSAIQEQYLEEFVTEYLRDLGNQLGRWGTASQGYGIAYSMPLPTRDALIRLGYLEVASARSSLVTERKGYEFGRRYETRTVASGVITLAPTPKGIDWWLSR